MAPASDLNLATSCSIPFVSTAFIAPRNPLPAASATAIAVFPVRNGQVIVKISAHLRCWDRHPGNIKPFCIWVILWVIAPFECFVPRPTQHGFAAFPPPPFVTFRCEAALCAFG